MVVVVDVVVWGCFVALGPGWRAIIDGTGNSALSQKILASHQFIP